MKASAFCTAVLGLLILAGGCESQPTTASAGLPVVQIKIGTDVFNVEVARTTAEQEKGLMKRDSMPKDHGMIFVFPQASVVNFWMKDTRFPLDILFLDSAGKIVSIHQMQAYDTDNTSSDFPARYAIELNKGAAAAAGAKVGQVIALPAPARSAGP